MPVGIEHVERPVAAGKIAPEPADIDLPLPEIFVRVDNLLQRADLKRDLVDQHAVLVMRLADALGGRGVDGGQRMVVGAVQVNTATGWPSRTTVSVWRNPSMST